MPNNNTERLEREALESLVAADLSAKMKQWRQPPPDKNRNRFLIPLALMLLALAGAAWLFWPASTPKPAGLPNAPATPSPDTLSPVRDTVSPPTPIADNDEDSPTTPARYVALARSYYHAPDFSNQTRGENASEQTALKAAKKALEHRRYFDALDSLALCPPSYQTDADYLRAHILFNQELYALAAVYFGKLTTSVRYGEAAQWYQILSLLPAYGRKKALVLEKLNRIAADNGHPYYKDANRLKQELLH